MLGLRTSERRCPCDGNGELERFERTSPLRHRFWPLRHSARDYFKSGQPELALKELAEARGKPGYADYTELYNVTFPVAAHSQPRWMSFCTVGWFNAFPSWPKASWKTRPLPYDSVNASG